MKPIPGSFQSLMKLSTSMRSGPSGKFYMLFLVLILITSGVFAQTVTWSESYEQGIAPTPEQHQRWKDFLASLKDKKFGSVTLSGTFDETGKTLSDPVAVENLAKLLNSGTVGSIVSNGQTWTVTNCDIGNGVFGIGLKVDGIGTSCLCEDTYALRPLSQNDDWGGVNSPSESSCKAATQTMKLEFRAAVTIVASGSTELCAGQKVVLTAQADICSAAVTYTWSNNATTQSIEVSEPGTYTVTVSDGKYCSATSSPFVVNYAETNVNIQVDGADVTEVPYAGQPIRLNAVGTSVGGKAMTTVNRFCMFDAPGGSGNCAYAPAPEGYICGEGLTEFTTTTLFEVTTSLENPIELRYNVYHTAWYQARINLKLNGETIEIYDDPNPPGECYSVFPTTVVLSESKIKGLWKSGSNTLAMEVIGAEKFFIANLSIEVVTSNVSFSWTPAIGLDLANVANPEATPAETTPYVVTFTDANGCKASDQVTVTVSATEAPIAVCKPLDIALTDNCSVTVTASDFNDGSSSPSGLPLTYSIQETSFGPGTHEVIFTVKDSNNKSSTCTTTITVTDTALPTIIPPADITVRNDPGKCTASVAAELLGLPVVSDNCGTPTVTNDQQDNVFDVGPTTVTWTVTDAKGNKQTATQLVTVMNADPIISSIVGPVGAVALGTNAVLGITYVDDNLSHATIDWGDGSPAAVMNNPAVSFEAGHAYASAGTYTVNITLTDMCGGETSSVYESIDIFNPRGGSVIGSGWFDSPRGADRRNPNAEGRANFSFDASYNGFSNIPEGSASFKFKTGNLNFKSSQFDILLIDGETARLTGSGSVNGKTGYSISISMVDDDTKLPRDKKTKKRKLADRIRVQVTDPAAVVIYDTQFGDAGDAIAATNIGAGSIEIDNSTSTFTDEIDNIFSGLGDESTSVYPNPFIDFVNIQFATESTADITVDMMDLAGRVITTGIFPVNAAASYTLDIPETANPGIYLLIIRQGERIEIVTVVKN